MQHFVTVKIGPEATPYIIHRDLLCNASKYFSNAFKGNFKEANDQSIHLTDVKPEVFDAFSQWLYKTTITIPLPGASGNDGGFSCACQDTGTISPKSNEPLMDLKDNAQAYSTGTLAVTYHPQASSETALLELAHFADKHTIPDLQNAVIDALHRLFQDSTTLPSLCSLRFVKDNFHGQHSVKEFVTEYFFAHLGKARRLVRHGEGESKGVDNLAAMHETLLAHLWQVVEPGLMASWLLSFSLAVEQKFGYHDDGPLKRLYLLRLFAGGICRSYHEHDGDDECPEL